MAIFSSTRAAALVALALGAAAAGDACAAGSQAGICRDTLADFDQSLELIQVGRTSKVVGGKEGADAMPASHVEAGAAAAATDAKADKAKQIPSWDSITSSVSSVAGSVSGAVAAVPGLGSVTGALAESAARQLVSTLQGTMSSISTAAEELVSSSGGYRAAVLQAVAGTEATLEVKAAALEKAVSSSVGEYLPQWIQITSSVNATTALVITALTMAGEADIAGKISGSMGEAMAKAAVITDKLTHTTEIVANISQLAEDEIAAQLSKLNKTLEEGLTEAGEYRSSLDESFAGMLNTAADALAKAVPGSNATALRATFAPLAGQEGEISGKLMASADTLLSGIGEATLSTEALLGKSGGARASSVLALGIAAVAASLAL